MADAPLVELVLSPRWAVRNVVFDGAPHTVLRIEHPRHGPIDFLLAGDDALQLAAGLDKTAERRETAQLGGTAPAVFNAANEAAVAAFLEGCIPFGRISHVIEGVLEGHRPEPVAEVETVRGADRWARRQAHELLR